MLAVWLTETKVTILRLRILKSMTEAIDDFLRTEEGKIMGLRNRPEVIKAAVKSLLEDCGFALPDEY